MVSCIGFDSRMRFYNNDLPQSQGRPFTAEGAKDAKRKAWDRSGRVLQRNRDLGGGPACPTPPPLRILGVLGVLRGEKPVP